MWITFTALAIAGILAFLEFEWEGTKSKRQRATIRLLIIAMILISIVTEVSNQRASSAETQRVLGEIRRAVLPLDTPEARLVLSRDYEDGQVPSRDELPPEVLELARNSRIYLRFDHPERGSWILRGKVTSHHLLVEERLGVTLGLTFEGLRSEARAPEFASLSDVGGTSVSIGLQDDRGSSAHDLLESSGLEIRWAELVNRGATCALPIYEPSRSTTIETSLPDPVKWN